MTPRGKKTVRDLRRGSRSTLLRRLYFDGPLSRQELGAVTGLSAGSISNVTGELLADGLIEECGSVESDGGRPRILLRVAAGRAHLVGVDVGETQVRVALFDLARTELAASDHPLSGRGHDVDHVVDLILAGLAEVLERTGTDPATVLGVGIGVPGIVEQGDPASDGLGIVVHGQTVGWDAVPLGRLLRAGTDLPLFVDNGAKTLGQAEMWFGAGRGLRHAVIALFGSGVGACVIADGARFRGPPAARANGATPRSTSADAAAAAARTAAWRPTSAPRRWWSGGVRRRPATARRRGWPPCSRPPRRTNRPPVRCSRRPRSTSARPSPTWSTCSTRSGS